MNSSSYDLYDAAANDAALDAYIEEQLQRDVDSIELI
jgi:hypothetical protein